VLPLSQVTEERAQQERGPKSAASAGLEEVARRLSNPFRPYMLWDKVGITVLATEQIMLPLSLVVGPLASSPIKNIHEPC
jgi:hypothetical protein